MHLLLEIFFLIDLDSSRLKETWQCISRQNYWTWEITDGRVVSESGTGTAT